MNKKLNNLYDEIKNQLDKLRFKDKIDKNLKNLYDEIKNRLDKLCFENNTDKYLKKHYAEQIKQLLDYYINELNKGE